ncbi:Heme chaperone HemW [Candidatus Magnetomoraceae bacterium gMMP-15]
MLKDEPKSAGLYIHIPFCIQKCLYCDFYSVTNQNMIESFIEALKNEISLIKNLPLLFDTIYFGGGTPSLLSSTQISDLIEKIYNSFNIASHPEITIEANPGTLCLENLKAYCQTGINRINIGVQSFNDRYLQFLGRIHTKNDACKAIEQARKAGFENIGLDLISGLPKQSIEAWQDDLKTAINMNPEHLSCYTLTYEPGTSLTQKLKNKEFQPLNDENLGNMMLFTRKFLKEHGYKCYEISNFARSFDLRSRHNQKYWSGAAYLGLGPSAHSFQEFNNVRYWNYSSLKKYIKTINKGNLPTASSEQLTWQQQMIEFIYLGLRRAEGINIKIFEKRFKVFFDKIFQEVLEKLIKKGLIEIKEKHCILTEQGMLLLDSAASEFVNII